MALQFSPQADAKISDITSLPQPQAACLPVLHLAQDEFGYLSEEVIELVAARLSIPSSHVFGVATFTRCSTASRSGRRCS